MSKIEVNQVDPQSGTTLTLGTSGDTVSIPSGVTLANAGTATGFFEGISWQSSIVTAATITVVSGRGYWLDTSSNAITVTLPAAPAVGDEIILTDYARNWSTNAVTINLNSLKFQGGTETPVYDTTGESVNIVYSGVTQGWIPNTDGAVALEGVVSYSVEQLIVAGGAGSGGDRGGGGGAGGFRTLTDTFLGGVTYAITVGAGGAAGAASGDGTSGGNSSVIGGSISNTSAGGGGGGGGQGTVGTPGVAGGSGGGGSANPSNNAPGGAGNTPATTPSQGSSGGAAAASWSDLGAGGGGGAGVGGSNGSGNTGGNGGNGTASSITGSAVTYAGGGGGGGNGGYGSGGSGGGGAGGDPGSAGTDGLGGGGGGIKFATSGTDGGDGIVILSMPDANYSGTTTGSPTVATGVSGKTVLTFTGSGSYTG